MNMVHVHLLLNHFPTVGFGIGVGLFLVSLIGKNEDLKRASFVIFFLVAALAIPTYVTGTAAHELLKDRTDVSESLVSAHEDAALLGFIVMELAGFIAWLGLWQFRLISRVPRWTITPILLLSVISFGLMARAANLGGEIRHPEIQAVATEAPAADTPEAGIARTLGAFVIAHTWVWPTCETLHFVGLSLLFTVVMIVDLRMLGIGKSLSFKSLYQLLPLGILGFGLNLATGMMFFLGASSQYTKNVVFYWKLAFIMIAAFNVLYFMLLDEPWAVDSGDDAPTMAKVAAASAIFLWVGVLFFGHMLPFIGNAF